MKNETQHTPEKWKRMEICDAHINILAWLPNLNLHALIARVPIHIIGREEGNRIANQIASAPETADERDRLKVDLENSTSERDQYLDRNVLLEKELSRLKEENEKLKGEVENIKEDHTAAFQLYQDVAKQRDKLQSLNAELLDFLKDWYMHEYAGNSQTLEEAIARAKPDLFEQKIIGLIQKAKDL